MLLVVLFLPTPYDSALAASLLTEPPATPTEVRYTPGLRTACLVELHRLGGLDGVADHNWFGRGLSFESELNCARGAAAKVRHLPTAPPLPCLAECREVAAFNSAVAARLWAEAEQASDHRAAELGRLAAECEGLAAAWAGLGGRELAPAGGGPVGGRGRATRAVRRPGVPGGVVDRRVICRGRRWPRRGIGWRRRAYSTARCRRR